jgi:hypothetical protein
VELSRKDSDAERRFIDAMGVARANQGASFQKAIPALEKLGAEYPKERLVQVPPSPACAPSWPTTT